MRGQFASAWQIRTLDGALPPQSAIGTAAAYSPVQRGIAPGDIDMRRISTLLGLLTMFAIAAACSDKTDKPGSDSTSGGESKLKKAGHDADEAVEEAGEDVSDKVDEATDK
jgi:hypothetical protein